MEFLPRRLSRNESDAMAARIRTDRHGEAGVGFPGRGGQRSCGGCGKPSLRFRELTLQHIDFEHPKLPPGHPLRIPCPLQDQPHDVTRDRRDSTAKCELKRPLAGLVYVPRDAELS
jgi:hypothetical protein